MIEIQLSADELVSRLLSISESEPVYILDSCGVGHLGSHLLIAGLRPVEVFEISSDDPEETLRHLDKHLSQNHAAVFTLSYDFGTKLLPTPPRAHNTGREEPDLFLAVFDALLIHDYDSGQTVVAGSHHSAVSICEQIRDHLTDFQNAETAAPNTRDVSSNFTRTEYITAVELIKEHIRNGNTYQTNLTQQLRHELLPGTKPESIYWRLRRDHPAPFSAFLRRPGSTVISASPERFFRTTPSREIESSPIKGTRRRGKTRAEDTHLREELLDSEKDRAENTMIVDLVRNDLGRVCEFGSVVVEKLCALEEHPTLFHLVSTVRGKLLPGVKFSDILRAVYPCGSITGAPKIRTMRIIDEIENSHRGLSMGAIGVYMPESWNVDGRAFDSIFDLSVAIRTMVIRDGAAVFNVGGGVVIDSDPEDEFDESLLKAQALLSALGASFR